MLIGAGRDLFPDRPSAIAALFYAFLLRSTNTVPPMQTAASTSQTSALASPVEGVPLLSASLDASDEAASDEPSDETSSDEVSEVSGT